MDEFPNTGILEGRFNLLPEFFHRGILVRLSGVEGDFVDVARFFPCCFGRVIRAGRIWLVVDGVCKFELLLEMLGLDRGEAMLKPGKRLELT